MARGFAALEPEKRRQIARKGGLACSARGNGHRWTPEQARILASQGGRAAHEKGRAHRWTPEQAREAGRKGGIARWQKTVEPTPVPSENN